MSGILEQILAEVQAIRQHQLAQAAGGYMQQAAPQQQYQQAAPQQQYQQAAPQQQQQAGLPPVPQGVTADAITALIQPHIQNQAVKDALGAAMRGMGINALPETQPHQFQELYGRFQQVIAQHTPGGAPQQQSAPASII